MTPLDQLKALIDDKLIASKADHILAERLVQAIRQQLEPVKPVSDESNNTRKS